MPKLIVNDVAQPVGMPQASGSAFGTDVARGTAQVGQAVSSLAQPLAAMSEQKARRAAAQFELDLNETATALSLTQDPEAAEKEFTATRKRLESQYRKGVGSRGIFDNQAHMAGEAIQTRFRKQNALKAIEIGQNELEQTLRLHADEMARADDPSERALGMMKAEVAIQDARRSGLIGDVEVDALTQNFAKMSMDGILLRLMAEDPSRGLHFVESEQFRGNENQRQAWRIRMAREHDSQMIRERQLEQARIKQQEAAEKEAERQWQVAMIEKASQPGSRITLADVEAMPFLSPATKEKWTKIAMGDGRLDTPEDTFNADVWRDDRRRVLAGESVEDVILDHIADGYYSRSVGEGLLSTARDVRFGGGRDILEAGLETAANGGDGIQATKYAQALNEYERWVRENAGKENVDDADAVEKANELVRRADTFGLTANPELQAFQTLLPQWAPFDEAGALDLDGFEAALAERAAGGQMTPQEAGRWAFIIKQRREFLRRHSSRRGGSGS